MIMTPLETGAGVCRVRVEDLEYLPNISPSPHQVVSLTAQTPYPSGGHTTPFVFGKPMLQYEYARITPLAMAASLVKLLRALGNLPTGMSSSFSHGPGAPCLRLQAFDDCARNTDPHTYSPGTRKRTY